MYVEKPIIAVWILSFLTFLAVLSDFVIVSYWVSEGPDFVLKPYILGDMINSYLGGGSVSSYFRLSIVATFIFFGLTCFVICEMPTDIKISTKILRDTQISLQKTQEALLEKSTSFLEKTGETVSEINQQFSKTREEILKDNRKVNLGLLEKVNTNFKDAQKETVAVMAKQDEKAHRDLVSAVEKNVNEIRKEMLNKFEKQEETIGRLGNLSRRSALALKEERAKLETIQTELEKIEEMVMTPKPILTSQDRAEKIRGIGPHLFKELKNLGITDVGELIVTDPVIIEEKVPISRKKAERFQAIAQLLMIPGVDEEDAEILIDAGITSKEELAGQDLVKLSRKIREIAKIYVEERKISKGEYPTIEEISSWIRMARYF